MAVNALIFDSGVGGFSIFEPLHQALPGLNTYYLMDNGLFPYGIQEDDTLIKRTTSLCHRACQQHHIDIVIIACNTASTLALPALRAILDVPVVGVVPAIKTAARLTQNHCIGLLATPATVNRGYIDDLIAQHAAGTQVVRIGSRRLVELAEQHWLGQASAGNSIDAECIQQALAPILLPFNQAGVDHIVLGCTHFPLLAKPISMLCPHAKLVDSGQAIAKRCEQVLWQQGHDMPSLKRPLKTARHGQHRLLTSAPHPHADALLQACQSLADFEADASQRLPDIQ